MKATNHLLHFVCPCVVVHDRVLAPDFKLITSQGHLWFSSLSNQVLV